MKVAGTTRVAAVLGWPVAHSRSPAIHNAAYAACGVDAIYVPMGVHDADLGTVVAGLRAIDFLGANVTLPHKATARALCERLSPEAEATGAVNTLVVTDGLLWGHNTDVGGFIDSMAEQDLGTPGHVVLLGAGGAARAIAFGLCGAGWIVSVAAREPARATGFQEQDVTVFPWAEGIDQAMQRAKLVIDTTPTALSVDTESLLLPVPLEALASDATVATLVYHRRPELLDRAATRGLRTFDGAGMLVHQAARAFHLMTGQPAPLDVMRAAFDTA